MKVLLLVPRVYSLSEMLYDGFKENGWEPVLFDYHHEMPHLFNRAYEKTSGLPDRVIKYWKERYYQAVNRRYIAGFEEYKPDMVLIYNNQFIFPETVRKFRERANVVFFLGDNPLWSQTFDYNLEILEHADLVLSPDSHWQFELAMAGVSNIICDHIGYSKKRFFPTADIPDVWREKYKSDLLYIGRNYFGPSGYKRTLFLNAFAGMNLKIFGTGPWHRWLSRYPDLKPHFHAMENRISHEDLNIAINCTKICPIDQNTGLIHGIHLRVFEAIGAGALPLVEWRKDMDEVFEDLLPVVKRYDQAKEIALHFLHSGDLRSKTVESLRRHLDTRYTPALYVKRILERLDIKKTDA